ncbi:Daple [Actinoplanes sp. TBRC 11911]|uniref:Daple n=1 Tax=Actinoplanes sp. TBRC 11911 TaxID=2729386 RepID=UPI0028985492|nr:Daple [Actinoplanes sp. TBRC 11911]
MNGWVTPDSPWSPAAPPPNAEDDVPSWRRPTGESRLFPRSQTFPTSAQPASAVPAPPPPGFVDADTGDKAERWPETRPRYSDLLAHLSPPGGEPARPPAPRAAPVATQDPGMRGYDVPTPNSAPPFPYEGDLEDTSPPAPTQRAAVPLVRPAAPGGRRPDWNSSDADSARHALSTTTQGMPHVDQPSDEAAPARPAYDPSSFPRRVSYEPAPAADGSEYAQPAAYAAFNRGADANDPRPADPSTRVLPQRVPAQPDVPKVPEPPLVEPTAETPQLARIATHLRRGTALPVQDRQEGFDVQAILAAVREVAGVRDASLRTTPAGAHSLRLDLSEGADSAEVSRRVARLLSERMGLDAAMQGDMLMPPPMPPVRADRPPAQRLPPPPPAAAPAPPVERPRQISSPPAPVVDPPMPERRKLEPTGAVDLAEAEPAQPRPLFPAEHPGPRVVIENVQVNTYGTDAHVEVRLSVGDRVAAGSASGPAVDGFLLRLCAVATAGAVDELLSTSTHPDGPARCFVEHAAAVPFGASQVAVVVLLLSCNGWVEQLAGSAVVTSDDRHAMVRATLAAVNRRLEALLSR